MLVSEKDIQPLTFPKKKKGGKSFLVIRFIVYSKKTSIITTACLAEKKKGRPSPLSWSSRVKERKRAGSKKTQSFTSRHWSRQKHGTDRPIPSFPVFGKKEKGHWRRLPQVKKRWRGRGGLFVLSLRNAALEKKGGSNLSPDINARRSERQNLAESPILQAR